MGCIIDFIIEFLGEIFGELIADIFTHLSDAIFPDKTQSKRMQNIIEWVSTITSILMFALFIFGLPFLLFGIVEDNSLFFTLGWIFLGISLAFILTGIAFKLIKSHKNK